MRMSIVSSLIAFAACADVALAQAPPTVVTPPGATATPPPSPNSSKCVPHETPAQNGTADKRKEALGDKLAKSDGLLCPPAGVDPEIRAPTPEGGRTPVIPPPGSPGGDPTVRPK
ncbi:MAG: hypothetical protein K5821_00270 [Nitrobacter sp.]|nr:hypothetical protein [Nitrobacter sp.]MCV0384859.1 hypothetical protein [Nitrobacter sp.]